MSTAIRTTGTQRARAIREGNTTDAQLDSAFGPAMPVPVSAPPAPGEVKFWQMPPLERPAMPYIHAAMHAAMTEIRAVAKDSKFEQGNTRYTFRGIDGVVNAAGPAFRKHGIIPTPTLIKVDYRDTRTTGDKATREVLVQVRYTFTALDGSCLEVEVPGESLDQSDKGTAKAMSVAYRICLLQMLAIPTDEPDPDASYHTRDGQTQIAPSVAKYILDKVEGGPLEGLAELWQIVLEHSAADRTAYTTQDNRSLTWYEVFGIRWNAAIAAIETPADGKPIYEAAVAAGVLGWRVGNATVDSLFKARSQQIRERGEVAARAVVAALEAAGNIEQVGAVEALLIEYAATKHIQPPVTEQLHAAIGAKRAALEAAAAEAGEAVTP